MEAVEHVLREGMTSGGFLSENAEALGMLSDAHPIAEGSLMLAVNGYSPEDGMHPPTFTVTDGGVKGLYKGFYDQLSLSEDRLDELLCRTFADINVQQTHPLGRYSAVLTELLAYDILSRGTDEAGRPLTYEEYAHRLSSRLPEGIEALRDTIREITGPRPNSEKFFSVSLAACRVTERDGGVYDLDVFTAGDFSLYLLDDQGMSPLWTRRSELLSGDDHSLVTVRRLTLCHPTPFALLLLSSSACEPSRVDERSMLDNPGMLWRHRMRKEDLFVRLLSGSTDLRDAVARATAQLVSRCPGWDSVTGAVMVCGGSFQDVKAYLPARLTRLEDLLALFPEGYDPEENVDQLPLETVERDFVLNAFRTRPGVLERTIEALSKYTEDMLNGSVSGPEKPMGPEGTLRLTWSHVRRVYEAFDDENTEDRRHISTNERLLRDLLSEHWIALRPVLCRETEDTSAGASAYDACLRLSRRVSALTARRRLLLEEIRQDLNHSLDVLDFQGEDWISGRGGEDSPLEWMKHIERDITSRVEDARWEWSRLSELMRSLRSAYTFERDRLFALDAVSEQGRWHERYRMILEGRLPEERWQSFGADIKTALPALKELWAMVKVLSGRNRVLRKQIVGRAVERRTVRAVSGDEEWQINCMLGALCEDEAWGEDCLAMIDNGFRNEYRAVVRRWQEENELIVRRGEAYETYRAMYEAYES